MFAFWLHPKEPTRSWLRQQIAELAHDAGSPAFEPHITLHVDRADPPLWAASVAGVRAFTVDVSGVGDGPDRFKSVFLRIAESAELHALAARLRGALREPDTYALAAHLSLIYQVMPAAQRAVLATRMRPPASFMCDAVSLVVPGAGGWSDVSSWREDARYCLQP
jgi:2'-5' RNA ligase